jgi:hypothetical protein
MEMIERKWLRIAERKYVGTFSRDSLEKENTQQKIKKVKN